MPAWDSSRVVRWTAIGVGQKLQSTLLIFGSHLFKLHDVGMKEAAVIDDLSLNIHACKPLSSLKKLDGNLHPALTESVRALLYTCNVLYLPAPTSKNWI